MNIKNMLIKQKRKFAVGTFTYFIYLNLRVGWILQIFIFHSSFTTMVFPTGIFAFN